MDAGRQPPAGDWLQGAAGAVLSFDVDAEAPILAEGDQYAEDLSAISHQAYGGHAGVPGTPEVARSLAQAGADLLVTISANMEPFGRDHEIFCTARALENGLPHLYVNQLGLGEGKPTKAGVIMDYLCFIHGRPG